MKKFNQLKSVLTDEFSVLNKESLMLVLGGQAHTVAAQGFLRLIKKQPKLCFYFNLQLRMSNSKTKATT